ncbi:MAG TPA: hypothetical protein VGQ75_02180 [Thermoanaerobaculia bacterium]|jgi:hypothetical protein|nr:hypothetical protein [Thermoanaerobaculia bacterium]
MLSGRAALRGLVGFLLALAFWFGFSRPYERTLAAGAQTLTNLFESPDVTRLVPGEGEILLDRRDLPPGSARPGLPAPDIHFNFVLLAALFAMDPRPLAGAHVTRFLAAAVSLWVIHVIALVLEIHSVYATSLGAWSQAHYGAVARNLWATGWHFYLIAGRFAAPFVLWWLFGRREESEPFERPRRKKRRRT